jgi:hypothetical protein
MPVAKINTFLGEQGELDWSASNLTTISRQSKLFWGESPSNFDTSCQTADKTLIDDLLKDWKFMKLVEEDPL